MSQAKAHPAAADEKPQWRKHFDRAVALCAEGASREAMAPLRAATRLNPQLTEAWRLAGDILTAGGDFRGARDAFDHAIVSRLRSPRLRAAAEALREGRLGEAESKLRNLTISEAAPSEAAMRLLGQTLIRRGRLNEAESVLRSSLQATPDLWATRLSLAEVLLAARRFPEALAEFDALLARAPSDYACLAMKAAALTELGRHGQAVAVSAAMLDRFPDQAYAWLVHANGLRAVGETDACIHAYQRCLDLDPRCAEAWLSLGNLKTYHFATSQIADIAALLGQGDLAAEDQAKLHFTLGKAYEDGGAYVEAFDHYARGNAIEASRRRYDPGATHAYVGASKALFSPRFFADRRGWGASAPDPIFIVGLPRSGSTLVEQILYTHPAIEGLDELADLSLLAASVDGYPVGLARASRQASTLLGAEYIRRTSAYRSLARRHFIDKTPKNFLHIGFILTILPNAKIVDVRRHPLACGVSIFKQHFGHGFASAFDLDHIGRYYAHYVELMAHYDEAAPGRVHRVIYEHLVADTETEVRKLLGYLGLPYDPACLRFFDNRRAVDTPSSEQVRQPIFTDGLESWRRFEPWLGPLKLALGPVLSAYPQADSARLPRNATDRRRPAVSI
jgi:tetratricopeptide (TPR) repeat protein